MNFDLSPLSPVPGRATGAVVPSSTYEIEFEHPDSPARFAARALNDVVELSATVTEMPAPVKSAALPVAAGAPEQVGLV
jgi:hypothetical protein